MHEWNLLTTLTRLDLDTSDYVIMGTGALIAYGLPREISDLDVLVRGRAWDKIWDHPDARPIIGSITGDKVVELDDGRLEFFEHWIDGATTDELIERGELILFEDWGTSRELRFASLEDGLRYKTQLNRSKDHADLDAIQPNWSRSELDVTGRALLRRRRRRQVALSRSGGRVPG